jgi:hypothetical protein
MYMCVRGIVLISSKFLLDFETVQTLWYFLFSIVFVHKIYVTDVKIMGLEFVYVNLTIE